MRSPRLMREIGSAIAACTALTLLAGCSAAGEASTTSGPFFGPSQSLGNGTARTYVALDEGGNPTEIGLRLTAPALDGLPETGPT